MEEDELDPRIQVELEKLNSATDVINKLEIELDEANTTFRMLLNECTRRLKVHSSKHGSAIENARPYYVALDIARRAQQDCQQAAVSFQRANEVHEAAKETVALAESRFMSQQPEWRFDSAWQEMLNHATLKVRDAEKQRAESSAYHGLATARYKDAQEKVQLLEQRLRRNVAKSRPYFEEKQRCNEQLAAQKEAVETLAAKVARVKSEYAASLRRLEGISEEIHHRRGNAQMGGCGVREPGVGAELEYTGEQTNCDTSRETTSYNYDAKFNANNLPDSNLTNSAIHSKDCQEVEARLVVGGFQSCDETVMKIPAVHSEIDTRRDVPQETVSGNEAYSERKISFESLHGLHFNPTKDSGLRFDDSECDSENETSRPTDVSLDLLPDFISPMTEASSSVSQGRYSLAADSILYGEVVAVEQSVRETGAKDNNLDIREKVDEDDTTKNVYYRNVESETDVNAACDQLEEIVLGEEDTGARGEDVDINEVATGMSKEGIAKGNVQAQGDAGQMSDGSKDQVSDNQREKQVNVGSGSQDLESSNTRRSDLEITYQHGKTKLENNDKDAALELSANTPSKNQGSRRLEELRDVSN